MKWENSVWFFDIDDTLINTDDLTEVGAVGIKEVFENKFGEGASKKVKERFIEIFNTVLAGYRIKKESDWENSKYSKEEVDEVLQRIEELQFPVQSEWGMIKKWSREVFIKIASDDLELQSSPELIHEAADAYWTNLSENTQVFPDAKELFEAINEKGRPIYLITSSDGRLKMRGDGKFEYDPEYSEGLKKQRLEVLREKGLSFRLISVGDPEDKPHLDFFEKGIKLAEEDISGNIDPKNCLIFGDSYAGDLSTPREKMGFGMVVLREKNRQDSLLNDSNYLITGDLTEVLKYLD